ncbi:MAG: nitroreductase family protein [Candidatus Saccharicenans sp.]
MERRKFLESSLVSVPVIAMLNDKDFSNLVTRKSRNYDRASNQQEIKKAEPGQLKPIDLPPPEKSGGKTVLEALWLRRTNRNIKPDPLEPQVLSNLLWAAFGINRGEGSLIRGKPGRTAASASNSQEIDLYVAKPEGVYVYEPVKHVLMPVVAGDFRARAGRRQGGAEAPVRIFFVVDLSRYVLEGQPDPRIKDPEVQKSYYYVATGLIAQNIYLYAASTGLAAWFHNCDRENTPAEFKLRPEQKVLFAMTVGHPA